MSQRLIHLATYLTLILFVSSTRATDIVITVNEPSGVPRTAWPVTSGIPLAPGQLRSDQQVALFDAASRQIPLQTETLARWPDGSIRWLLLDFQVDLAAGQSQQFLVRCGTAGKRDSTNEPPLVVTIPTPAQPIVPRLETGPLRIQLAADRLRLLDAIWLDVNEDGQFSDDERLTDDRATGIVLIATDGRRYRADLSLATWTVEQHGPLRACIRIEGRHAAGDDSMFRYVVRMHAFRGQPFLMFDYTFINDYQEALMANFDSIEIVCSLKGGGGQLVLNRKAVDPSRLVQVDDRQYQINGQASPGRAAGWAAVTTPIGGLAIGVREFWQNWPKSLTVKTGELRIGLCPDFPQGQYDGHPLLEEVKHYYYLRDGVYSLKVGTARTHRLWALPFAGATNIGQLREFFRATERPLLAQCTPDYVSATGVLSACPPADTKRYHGYDAWFDKMFEKHLAAQESNRENGLLNFGDWYDEKKFGGGWGNQEYDTAHCFFVQYLRTGDRRYFDRARQGAGHLMDVDILHDVNPQIRGLDHHGQPQPGHIWTHSVGHTGGYYDGVALPAPIWYQRGMLQNLGHVWIGGLCDDYLLTGDRRALDIARLAAERVASEGGRYSNHLRDIGWPLNLLMTAWETTGEDKYLVAARRHWQMLRKHFSPQRGWVTMLAYGHCTMQSPDKRCRGQNSYLLALTLSALARYHQATGDPAVLQAISAGLDQMIRECWDERSKAFWATACIHLRDGGRRGNSYSTALLASLAFAHEIRLTDHQEHRRIYRAAFQAAMESGRAQLESGHGQAQAGYASRAFHFTPFGLKALHDDEAKQKAAGAPP